jgi:hypothetical protein
VPDSEKGQDGSIVLSKSGWQKSHGYLGAACLAEEILWKENGSPLNMAEPLPTMIVSTANDDLDQILHESEKGKWRQPLQCEMSHDRLEPVIHVIYESSGKMGNPLSQGANFSEVQRIV